MPTKRFRAYIAAGVVVTASMVSGAAAATLVRMDPVGEGAFQSFQDGSLAMRGPRYNQLHELLTIRNLGNDAWTGTMQSDQLMGTYGVGVNDPVYYPAIPVLSIVEGSVSTYLTLSNSGGGGGVATAMAGEGFSGASATTLANHLQMGITQTLWLQAYPQTWQNEPGDELGTHDNEVISLLNDYSSRTINDATGGYIRFRIDPVFQEKAGDVVPVTLSVGTMAEVSHQFGNTGYTGYGQVNASVLVNGSLVTVDGEGYARFDAAIGDVISIKMDSLTTLRGSDVLQEPDNPFQFNRPFNPVSVVNFVGCSLDIPLTRGTAESVPLLPGVPPTGPEDPYVFSDLVIGASGLGIDTPLWIDPAVAIGYDFTVLGAGVNAVVMPSGLDDPTGFVVSYYDASLDDYVTVSLNAWGGEQVNFPHPVQVFFIGGIEESLALDPLNTAAFPVGLFFDGPASGVQVTMTPLATPEPATLLFVALGGLAMLRRRRSA